MFCFKNVTPYEVSSIVDDTVAVRRIWEGSPFHQICFRWEITVCKKSRCKTLPKYFLPLFSQSLYSGYKIHIGRLFFFWGVFLAIVQQFLISWTFPSLIKGSRQQNKTSLESQLSAPPPLSAQFWENSGHLALLQFFYKKKRSFSVKIKYFFAFGEIRGGQWAGIQRIFLREVDN